MKQFKITVLYNGKLETIDIVSSSVGRAKQYLNEHWAENGIVGAKIIKVEKV